MHWEPQENRIGWINQKEVLLDEKAAVLDESRTWCTRSETENQGGREAGMERAEF